MRVKGYMLRTDEMIEKGLEQLFAAGPEGTIITCIKNYSNNFYEKGVKWEVVFELPKHAEFIGDYILGGSHE